MLRTTLLLAALAIAAPALAQPDNPGRDPDRGRGHDDRIVSDSPLVGVLFGPDAEMEIRSYFRANPYESESLPPGIAMNLERGKTLPPGIAKRYLPDELRARLPEYPYHEIVLVDGDALLIATATMVIVDVLSDVL